MLYESCFPKVEPGREGLCALGFALQEDGTWLLQKSAETPGFSISYCVVGNSCRVEVTDAESGWEYDLFNVPSSSGAVVSSLREEAEKLIETIGKTCFGVCPHRAEVLRYCKEVYGTNADYPFRDSTAQALRKPSGKWYGLLMTVPAEKLDPRKKGDVSVLNLKATPARIAAPDFQFVFPAWHMNRKYWISVLLDSNIPAELLHTLIDESYGLVK